MGAEEPGWCVGGTDVCGEGEKERMNGPDMRE